MKPIFFDKSKESISLAEQIVIGSILLDSTILPMVEQYLKKEDFADERHQKIFLAIQSVNADGNVVDSVSVFEFMHRVGTLSEIGGPKYLNDLADNVGSSSQAEHYAKKVREASISRQYARECKTITEEAQQAAAGQLNLSELVIKHEARLKQLSHDCEIINANKIDYLNANPENIYKIFWPLGLHKWVNLFPKNIAIVAGASNAGKTAFLLNVAHDNCHIHPVRYLSSEMGPEELRLRLQLFNYHLNDWKSIDFYDRSSDFSPLIEPDSLNIIDFLEIYDNFYAIGSEIKAIYDRLKTGIAIIGIQKKSSSQFARGGEFTLEKARMYVSIDPGLCKIIKGKNWAQPGVNPKDMEFHYKLYNGCKFIS